MRIAIIGGSGVYDIALLESREEVIQTKYGAAKIMVGQYGSKEIIFLARHGKGHKIPPEALLFSPSGKTCSWPTPEGYGYLLGGRSWNLLGEEE